MSFAAITIIQTNNELVQTAINSYQTIKIDFKMEQEYLV